MSLTLALNNSLSGLSINRQSLAVLSQNIANANTAGYTRKIVDQESLYLDGNGSGVSIKDINRKVDEYLVRSIRNESSSVGMADTVNDYADRIQILLGKPGNKSSIDASIGSFFNAIQSLASTPENSSLRVNAVNLGKTLAGQINSLSSGLNDLRFQADQDISFAVSSINSDLVQIDKLNKTIQTETSLGKSVGELLDKRDGLVKDLAGYLDIQVYSKSTGEINISTNSGLSLLDDNVYKLSYNTAGSVDSFVNEVALAPLEIYRLDEKGNQLGSPNILVSSGTSDTITSYSSSGKLSGLLEMRDKQIPAIIKQIDNLAAVLRDQLNIVHNTGTGFPGVTNLTGTHLLVADDYAQWGGEVRIAVLDADGKPVSASYADESVTRPLTLDLSDLNTGNGAGAGQPNIQGIIDEINRTFGVPQTKVELGNINDIRLVSNSATLPNSAKQLNFDFNVENISATDANLFVTGVQVLDSNGVALATPTSTLPTVALAGTYTSVSGSKVLTVNSTGTHGLKDGDVIYLSPPSGAIDGIPADNFGQFFTVGNVQAGSFDVTVATAASSGGAFTVAGQTAMPKYAQITAGDSVRTKNNGTITADLSGNTTSPYYTVKVDLAVDDGQGNVSISTVSYRVNNNDTNLLNERYAATAATGDGKIIFPSSLTAVARALLVDENGVELAKINGVYTTNQAGYLKIEGVNSNSYIAIDSLDSVEQGKPNDTPPTIGTNRSFSHYFGLNNFFVDDSDIRATKTTGSAAALKVEDRLTTNPNLIALGKLSASPLPSDASKPSLYSYERNVGDNSIIQALAKLGIQSLDFATAGGLGQTKIPFGAYAGQIIGAAATNANISQTDKSNSQTLLDGYSQRSDSISGVNLDEELANTIIYQNSYSASARIITVVNTLFDTLLQSVG
ncbi:MAG: flagellar hook-associated protein FlgK [Rickettsiales bacterium]|jgi:flagellar hook-associated protein 1 FlgK